MKNRKYHTVGTVPKSNRKTKNTTLTEQFQNPIEKQKNTTLSEQFQNQIEIQKIPHCRTVLKSNRKTKNTTLSEQFQNPYIYVKNIVPYQQSGRWNLSIKYSQ